MTETEAPNVPNKVKMSPTEAENVQERAKMSKTEAENVQELTEEELALPLEPIEPKSAKEKSQRRKMTFTYFLHIFSYFFAS